jgi:hypothetical protein
MDESIVLIIWSESQAQGGHAHNSGSVHGPQMMKIERRYNLRNRLKCDSILHLATIVRGTVFPVSCPVAYDLDA